MKNEHLKSTVFFCALLVCACETQEVDRITIKNNSNNDVVDFRLSAADYTSESLTIGEGKSIIIYPEINTDGGLGVSYDFNGNTVTRSLGYITPAIPKNCTYEISGEIIEGSCQQL